MTNQKYSAKILLIVVLAIALPSCWVKVYTLSNGMTRVPVNPKVYKNKSKFNTSILKMIDTTVIYEELNTEKNILERFNECEYCPKRYVVLKFYSNGCYNIFAFWKNEPQLPVSELDPNYAGFRGIYYLENNKIKYDEFGAIDEWRHIGRIKGTFTISGDTLYEKMDDRKGIDATKYTTHIYVKRRLPPEYFIYRVDW